MGKKIIKSGKTNCFVTSLLRKQNLSCHWLLVIVYALSFTPCVPSCWYAAAAVVQVVTHGGLGIITAGVFLAGEMAGSGVLALPFAMVGTGDYSAV